MTNKTLNKIILSATTAMFLTACGGGGGGTEDTTKPDISLTSGNVSLTVGDTYSDAGATAIDDVDGDITSNITTTGTVDTSTVGTYTITYNVSDAAGNAADPITRTITVNPIPVAVASLADAAAQTYTNGTAIPTLTFTNSGGPVASCSVAPALPTGLAVAANNNTCEIAGTPTVVTATATYTVTGKNATGSDTATVAITVNDIPDIEAPIVTAINPTVTVPFGGTYVDAGATAIDNVDGNITAKIVTTGSVDTNTAGDYTITYTATDLSNNTGNATTVVTVSPRLTINTATVTDTLTGLVWDKNASDVGSCGTKSEPTIEQFQTIIDYTKSAPALPTGFNIAANYDKYKTSDGWKILLRSGAIDNNTTDATKTICVDATNEVNTTFKPLTKDSGTNEVTDLNTGLIWADKLELKTYDDAVTACTANGAMRLPTIEELDSIYDREANKTVAPFTDIHNGHYWSSTSSVEVGFEDSNWVMAFDDVNSGGNTNQVGQITGKKRASASGTLWFRCVKDAN